MRQLAFSGGNAPCSCTQPSLFLAHLLVSGGGFTFLQPWMMMGSRGGEDPLVDDPMKIQTRMLWTRCSHEFPTEGDSLAKRQYQGIVNTGWNCFQQGQHQHHLYGVAASYAAAFPLIHAPAFWSLVMFLWNHQWICQVWPKSRFWMVKYGGILSW